MEKCPARNILALFGAHDLSDCFESVKYHLSPKKVHLHEDWNPRTSEYDADVSLLEFEEGFIHFNDFVQPICLWSLELEPAVSSGIVVGWGKTEDPNKPHENVPKMVMAVIQSNEDCFLDAKPLVDLSSKRTFCAGLRNGSGVCHGDSGGGLFVEVNGMFHLKGIVSSSLVKNGDCDVSTNAVYTNVLKFKDWIDGVTGVTGIRSEFEFKLIILYFAAVKKVFCTFTMTKKVFAPGLQSTCVIDQDIDTEDFVLGTPKNSSIGKFDASNNRQMKYLLKDVGKTFPNLFGFIAEYCKLTVVRNYYFKDMQRVQFLTLGNNQIASIEAHAFDDLTGLIWLSLHKNMLETLDGNVFATMAIMEKFHLSDNKIKSLSLTTFKIPGNKKLWYIDFNRNVCVNKFYYNKTTTNTHKNLNLLESDIRAKCLQ